MTRSNRSKAPKVLAELLQDMPANDCRLAEGSLRQRVRALVFTIGTMRTLSVLLFRAAQVASRRSATLGFAVKQLNQLVTGADLSWRATIGPGLVLRHPVGVVIGDGVVAGRSLTLQQGVTLGGLGAPERVGSPNPTLGDFVEVGAGARILGPVTVGSYSSVGANAVVLMDVPPHHLAVGVPARTIAKRS